LFLFWLALSPLWAEDSTNVAPRALPVSGDVPAAVPGGVDVRWFGHGFVFLTSSVGIRAAIDPFGPDTVKYKFPVHLTADFVLVTHESEDHCAAELIFGNPLIFRSVMAVGLQRANGIPFHGVALHKDPGAPGGANTAYTLTFDGVTFGYLGQITQALGVQEKIQLGHIDVLFLPIGLPMTVAELNQVAKDVGARIIIPVNYKTDLSGDLNLRTLDDYLSETKLPVRRISSSDIVVTRDSLPADPTIYLLKSP
jgi:L-ascorbate metabolism protein UlaG (beta-lactamase superfamily)